MATGIQCTGIGNVVSMYEYKGINTWAVFQQKQFIHAGTGVEDLEEFLGMLEAKSVSGYTLKVYRNVADPDQITDKTECNGSFNFKLQPLVERDRETVSGLRGGSNVMDVVTAKIAGAIGDEVAEIIDRKFNGEPEPEKKQSFGDVILGLINEPAKLNQLIAGFNMLTGRAVAAPAQLAGPVANPVRRAGGNENIAGIATAPDDDPDKLRLVNAIDRLSMVDPDIISTLERLADLGETNKPLYDTAKTMLPPKK